jgi:hypothetical protein
METFAIGRNHFNLMRAGPGGAESPATNRTGGDRRLPAVSPSLRAIVVIVTISYPTRLARRHIDLNVGRHSNTPRYHNELPDVAPSPDR